MLHAKIDGNLLTTFKVIVRNFLLTICGQGVYGDNVNIRVRDSQLTNLTIVIIFSTICDKIFTIFALFVRAGIC